MAATAGMSRRLDHLASVATCPHCARQLAALPEDRTEEIRRRVDELIDSLSTMHDVAERAMTTTELRESAEHHRAEAHRLDTLADARPG